MLILLLCQFFFNFLLFLRVCSPIFLIALTILPSVTGRLRCQAGVPFLDEWVSCMSRIRLQNSVNPTDQNISKQKHSQMESSYSSSWGLGVTDSGFLLSGEHCWCSRIRFKCPADSVGILIVACLSVPRKLGVFSPVLVSVSAFKFLELVFLVVLSSGYSENLNSYW